MTGLAPPFRAARAEDGPALARLMDAAGEGLPLAMWRFMAEPGVDPLAFGAERLAEYAKIGGVVVADQGGGPVAMLTGYAIRAPRPVGDDMPAPIRPLQELENRACPSWYVDALAALPEQRGRGYGSRLMAIADQIAGEAGLPAVSLIVSDGNARARSLYRRLGFADAAAAPMTAAEGWTPVGENWILMVKRLGA